MAWRVLELLSWDPTVYCIYLPAILTSHLENYTFRTNFPGVTWCPVVYVVEAFLYLESSHCGQNGTIKYLANHPSLHGCSTSPTMNGLILIFEKLGLDFPSRTFFSGINGLWDWNSFSRNSSFPRTKLFPIKHTSKSIPLKTK